MKAEEICEKLNIDYSKVLNIYKYGSKVYGTDDEYSDSDYIIVYKTSFLPSGAFKDNAISSDDREIQGVCYSRAGFIDAINNYDISALECIFLPDEEIIQEKEIFKITKFNHREFSKKIITKSSSSWYFARLSFNDGNIEESKVNMYHALRILDFGNQIKTNGKIINYSSMNKLKEEIENDIDFKPKNYHDLFIKLSEDIK